MTARHQRMTSKMVSPFKSDFVISVDTNYNNNNNDHDKNTSKISRCLNCSAKEEEQRRNCPAARFNLSFHYFRYIVICLGGFLTGWMFLFRYNFNVVVISMVNKTAINDSTGLPNRTTNNSLQLEEAGGEFDWTNEIQQLIMTGYMVSYALPQIMTTRLSIEHGLGRSMPISLGICSLSSLLTPYFAYWGWRWVLLLRLINGVGASAILPCMFSLIEIWMPREELAKGFSVFQMVNIIVQVLVPLICGQLASVHWSWAFYVPGAIGVVICALWLLLVTDEPHSSKLISERELHWIIGDQNKQQDKLLDQQRAALPWHFVFKITVFLPITLALILVESTFVGFYFIMPSYLQWILSSSVENIGFISFLVQVTTVCCTLWPNLLTSYLESSFGVALTNARRFMSSTCSVMVCLSFFYLAIHHDNLISVITINRFFHISIEVIIFSTILTMFSGQKLSGMVFSVSNSLAMLSIMAICWAFGKYLDVAGESVRSWSLILTTLGALNVIYLINYLVFCPSVPIHVELPKLTEDEKKSKSMA